MGQFVEILHQPCFLILRALNGGVDAFSGAVVEYARWKLNLKKIRVCVSQTDISKLLVIFLF